MSKTGSMGQRLVGDGHRVVVIAEIGINHNGDLVMARRLIDAARTAGCDPVEFQKRTPDLCVPLDQRDIPRETPWGLVPTMGESLAFRHLIRRARLSGMASSALEGIGLCSSRIPAELVRLAGAFAVRPSAPNGTRRLRVAMMRLAPRLAPIAGMVRGARLLR